ncbi:uncharacterized protein LOC122614051 [Drosophila teissieri]|uniref:uncharacterized protein LOC122614051 n=1 Tax=Drosophila teissieri TaxID=7243 RepID=UPI001CB9F158|nr:uncharacterized protein LOC122614051 [Drosophila teissieri]XP_043644450.1 uncharacterized protein LOC122614051 [Drosophila teissieri]
MCCNASRQNCCIVIGFLAIIVGFADLGYRTHLIVTYGWNRWLLVSAIGWIVIILAAVLLLVGAIKQNPTLLVIWIIVVLICGVIQILVRIVLFTPGKKMYSQDAYHIVAGGIIIILILLVFSAAYYPYAYKRELEEEEYE